MTAMLKPASEAELAETVQRAAGDGAGLEIVGGGTRLGIGRPVETGTRLSVAGLSGITLYEPASLIVIVRAGTPLAELEAVLAAEGQMLAFEPADWRALLATTGEPTIGGTFAAGVSGPRRIQAGACRDAAIGVRFVNASGEILKSGGRVMKNVTGYDLVKLQCGAYGTLGVVSELTFKLLPRPETASMLIIPGLDDAEAVAALSKALASPYGVSGAAHLPKGEGGEPATFIRIEGFAASVAHRAGRLREELAGLGDIAVETDPTKVDTAWRGVRDVEAFAGRPGAVWKISLKPSDGPKLVAEVKRARDVEAIYDWGGGLVWLLTGEEGDAGAADIRGALGKFAGHATLIRAGADTRRNVAVFQPEAPAIAALSVGLRRQFDPKGILNPGRMGGGDPAVARTA